MNLENIVKSNLPFNIKVITKASCNKIYIQNGIIKVKVREVAENGKANKAIIDLFSETFRIPKSNIQIIKGATTSKKTMKIIFN